MMDTRRFEQLKERAERYRREADKAEGALTQALARLKEEYGCGSIEEAEALLVDLEQKAKKAEERCVRMLHEFEKKWGDKLP